MFHAIYERGFGYFGGGGGGVKRGGNFDDGGPLWTNGQHGYKIDCLIIMYYNCAGVEWSSDPPTTVASLNSSPKSGEEVPSKISARSCFG